MKLRLLIQKAHRGDKQSKEELIEMFKPFIFKEANKYFAKGYDKEDFVQQGILSVLKTINKVDMDRLLESKSNLPSYFCTSIKNNYLDLIKKEGKNSSILSLDNQTTEDKEANASLLDTLAADDNIEKDICLKETNASLYKSLYLLDPLERELVEYMYLSNKKNTATDFIKNHNITFYQFNKIKSKALMKINQSLKGDI